MKADTEYQKAEDHILEQATEIKMYTCPLCGGSGRYLEEYIDGYPRYEGCEICHCSGKVDGHMLGVALNIAKKDKKETTIDT